MSVDFNVGFMGAGGIATAMTKGLCSSPDFGGKVFVFAPRIEKAESLKSTNPNKIYICSSNQEVIDNSDFVVPALVPDILEKVAGTLKFREENHIIHLAAGINLLRASQLFSPAKHIVRAVPLPFTSKRIGPIVLFGNDIPSEKLLSLLGTVINVNTEKDMEVLAAVTGLMVPYYGLVNEVVKWSMTKGLDFRNALDYTCRMNEALSILMRQEGGNDVKAIEAFMSATATPGGLNELAWNELKEVSGYSVWVKSLEKIGKRYDL